MNVSLFDSCKRKFEENVEFNHVNYARKKNRTQEKDTDHEDLEKTLNWETLPIEIKFNVYDYLSLKDRLKLRLVNKESEDISNFTIKNELKKREYKIQPLDKQKFKFFYENFFKEERKKRSESNLIQQVDKLINCPDAFREKNSYPYHHVNLKKLSIFEADFFVREYNKSLFLKHVMMNENDDPSIYLLPKSLSVSIRGKQLPETEYLHLCLSNNLEKFIIRSENIEVFDLLRGIDIDNLEYFEWGSFYGDYHSMFELDSFDVNLLDEKCPKLKHLIIRDREYTTSFVTELINSSLLKNLKTLVLEGSIQLAEFCDLIKSPHLAGLEHLGLPYYFIEADDDLNDREIMRLIEAFNESKMRLTTLEAPDLPAAIKIISHSKVFHNLQYVKKSNFTLPRKIPLDFFKELLNAPHLENLDLWTPLANLEEDAYFDEDFDEIYSEFVKKQKMRKPCTELQLSDFPHHVQLKILKEGELMSHVKSLRINLQFDYSNYTDLLAALFAAASQNRLSNVKKLSIEGNLSKDIDLYFFYIIYLNGFLNKMTSIKSLRLKKISIDDQTISVIKEMKDLQKLVIRKMNLSEHQISKLRSIHHLKKSLKLKKVSLEAKQIIKIPEEVEGQFIYWFD